MHNSQEEKEQCNELPIYSYMLVLWNIQLSHLALAFQAKQQQIIHIMYFTSV
jgi:hypothetical protein